MSKEVYKQLFLFDKDAMDREEACKDMKAEVENWSFGWDTEIKDQLENLKEELELFKEAEQAMEEGPITQEETE